MCIPLLNSRVENRKQTDDVTFCITWNTYLNRPKKITLDQLPKYLASSITE
jgi:hypothetical protein